MSKTFKFILLIFLSTIITKSALFENEYTIRPIKTLEQLSKIKEGEYDHVSLVIYWHEDCSKCKGEFDKVFYDLALQNEGYFKLF